MPEGGGQLGACGVARADEHHPTHRQHRGRQQTLQGRRHQLEVRAAPVGVLDFMAAAMQPDNLVKAVGLKVLVNDKEVVASGAGDSSGAAASSTDDNSGDSSGN